MDNAEFLSRSHFLQAYLISGPAGSGKLAAAQKLAAAMVCSGEGQKPCGQCRNCRKSSAGVHPDITLVTRLGDKREITVDQIRALRADTSILPNEAKRKVYIICDAQSMNAQAQNALLKTLEEPPSYVTFLLLADNPSRLLETVLSRCAEIRMTPSGTCDFHQEEAEAMLSTLLHSDRLQMAEALFALEKLDKPQLYTLFCALRASAADLLRAEHANHSRLTAILSAVDEGDQYLDANINAGSIAGLFLARLL